MQTITVDRTFFDWALEILQAAGIATFPSNSRFNLSKVPFW
jgi:hypothetical protein